MFPKMKHAKSAAPDLRGDRAFKAALAKEYGVEKVPKSFQRAMDEVYRRLPEDMPQPHRPVRNFVRRTAAACAMLALVFLGLLGVNARYPQLTEAIPGLGAVFAAINGGEKVPPTPPVRLEVKPEFQPVTVQSQDGMVKSLTVEDAWSDGNTLYMDLSLLFSQEAAAMLDGSALGDGYNSPFFDTSYSYVIDACVLDRVEDETGTLIPSMDYNRSITVDWFDVTDQMQIDPFTYHGQGRATTQAVVQLSGREVGDEMQVSLHIPDLSVFENNTWNFIFGMSPGFTAEFTVPVDKPKEYMFNTPVQDNGLTVERVEFSPSKVAVDVEAPYIGRAQDLMLPLDEGGEYPLGLFPQLLNFDNSPVFQYEIKDQEYLGDWQEFDEDGSPNPPPSSWRMRFTFTSQEMPRSVRGPLRLTFYETPQRAQYADLDTVSRRRVVAEFTINLDTGRIMPSSYYKDEGREKVDLERDISALVRDGYVNGFRVVAASAYPEEHAESPAGEAIHLSLHTDVASVPHELWFNCYRNGALLQQFAVETMNGNIVNENGGYYEGFYPPLNGLDEQIMIGVYINYPEWAYDPNGGLQVCERIELVNGETGRVIIEDLEEARDIAYQAAVGAGVAYGDTQDPSTPERRPGDSSSSAASHSESSGSSPAAFPDEVEGIGMEGDQSLAEVPQQPPLA